MSRPKKIKPQLRRDKLYNPMTLPELGAKIATTGVYHFTVVTDDVVISYVAKRLNSNTHIINYVAGSQSTPVAMIRNRNYASEWEGGTKKENEAWKLLYDMAHRQVLDNSYTIIQTRRCKLCNSRLSTHMSLLTGYGPDCLKRHQRNVNHLIPKGWG